MSGLSWWHIAILLVVLVIIGAIVAVVLASRPARAGRPSTRVIGITLFLAAVWAGGSMVGAIMSFAFVFIPSAAQNIRMPVTPYWPLPVPGVTLEGPTATVVSGGFLEAEVVVEGLSTGTRLLWASGQALEALVPGAIGALVAVVCFQLLRGAPFAPAVARAALITALVVLVGGIAEQILTGLGGSLASNEVLQLTSAEATGMPDGWDISTALPQPASGWTVTLWPIGAALGFAALAAVFRYGSRLQRDTEGLV